MSEPDIQIQRDYPQTLVNSQWVKWAAERIAELEAEVAPLEGRKVIDMLKYVDSLERKVVNLTAENKTLREALQTIVSGNAPHDVPTHRLYWWAVEIADAALQEQGE